jgi:foldase protein PrsA
MNKRGLPALLAIVTCVTSINIYGCSLPLPVKKQSDEGSGTAGTDTIQYTVQETGEQSGDSSPDTAGDTAGKKKLQIVLTAGFKKNEIFRIATESCMKPELMVYMTDMQNSYSAVYGSRIWNTKKDGVTLAESVRENALARITRVKTMNLMAARYNVTLDRSELSKTGKAAAEYYDSLSPHERSVLGVTSENVRGMYNEYALADKVYSYIIKDINPEVSDDEARTITVSQILIRTYSTAARGKRTEFNTAEKQAAKKKCEDILAKIRSGADFDEMARKYNEDAENTLSFGKGQVDQKFEDAAFNLGTDEISGVVETADGYRIIKCITAFDKQQTEANKKNIVSKKRQEVFSSEYDSFAKPLTRSLNEKLWDRTELVNDSKVTVSDFFDIYRKYFPQDS